MNGSELLLHPTSKLLLDTYVQRPQHGLLLQGRTGAGLYTIASAVAHILVDHPTDIVTITPDEKGTISIETVRGLYVQTRDARKTRQVVVIDNADAMSIDAQNAFLKLLEEPTEHTFFILTSHATQQLLDTIKSRSVPVEIRPVSREQTIDFIKSHNVTDQKTMQQLMFIADGLPAERPGREHRPLLRDATGPHPADFRL